MHGTSEFLIDVYFPICLYLLHSSINFVNTTNRKNNNTNKFITNKVTNPGNTQIRERDKNSFKKSFAFVVKLKFLVMFLCSVFTFLFTAKSWVIK